MPTTPVTLAEAANQFQLWRTKQNSKFSSIPTHLRDRIRQLIVSYPVSQIVAALNISKATIYSIKKEQAQGQGQDQNSHILAASTDNPEQALNFIPFKLVDTIESEPAAQSCICQIIKPNGAKLVINIPDPTNVIKAFLCYN